MFAIEPLNQSIEPLNQLPQPLHVSNLQHYGEHDNSELQSFNYNILFRANATEMKFQEEHSNDRTKCIESPQFNLNNLSWKIKLCRRHLVISNGADEVDVSLVSVFNGNTATWSCNAKMNITILPNDSDGKPINRQMEWHNFNKFDPSNTIRNISVMKDLYHNYMGNDLVIVAITISTQPPNRSDPIALDEVSKTFYVRVKNLNKLNDQQSNEICVRGINWRVLTTKINDHLAIFVIANGAHMDVNKSWMVSATFQLISFDQKKIYSKNFVDIQFSWMKTENWGFVDFLTWNEFIDPNNEYTKNNASLIRIILNVGDPKTIL